MAGTVKDILNSYGKKYNIRLISGAGGLNGSVNWAYLAEDMGNFGFLKSGELIITTGYFTLEGISLEIFLNELISGGFAGLIINTGKYITEGDITPAIISLCNEKSFPLFVMPWEVQISDLMRDVCGDLISSSQRREPSVEEALKAVIKGSYEENIEALEKAGFTRDKTYRVVVCQEGIKSAVKRVNMPKSICTRLDGGCLCVCVDSKNLKSCFNPKIPVGISSPKQGLEALSVLYEEAKDAFKVSAAKCESPVFYEDLGLLKLLLKISDEDFLKSYSKEKIGVLTDYDAKHETNLTETLFFYILSGASPSETAKIMYTHRNTVTYRINKIKELLNNPLSNFEAEAEILAAIYIYKMEKQKQVFYKEK